jgi:hypothetical protein
MISKNWKVRTASAGIEPLPRSVGLQIFELLRAHGFSVADASKLAIETAQQYTSSPQSLFLFPGGLKVEIIGCRAKVISRR